MQQREPEGPLEISLVGDLTDNESELTDKLLGVEPGGECEIAGFFRFGACCGNG